MRISPPLVTVAIVVLALAGTAWLQPPQQSPAQVTVVLPAATYDKLLLQAQDRIGSDGRHLTVPQFIETLARD